MKDNAGGKNKVRIGVFFRLKMVVFYLLIFFLLVFLADLRYLHSPIYNLSYGKLFKFTGSKFNFMLIFKY